MALCRKESSAKEETAASVLRDVLPLLDPDAAARYDAMAESFWRETGLMAPGKSVPLEMAMQQPPEDVLRDQWVRWQHAYVERLYRRAMDVLEGDPA